MGLLDTLRRDRNEPPEIFELLGVGPRASEREIRRAYKRLMQLHHPDRSDDPDAEERFKAIQSAYSAYRARLANDEERARPLPARTEFDRESRVLISVEQAFSGCELDIRLDPLPGQDDPDGGPAFVRVRIPAGVQNGETLRVRNVVGSRRGDLYLNIEVKKDRRFKVVGSDVICKLKVAPWEAVLGGIIDVATLEGLVQVAIKPGSVAGQRLRLQGRGLQHPSGGRGDLYCVLEIVVPDRFDDTERDLYRRLAEHSRFNPRTGEDGPSS